MKIFRLLTIVIIVGMAAGMAAAQSVTLSTYYPAPFGSYDRFRLVPHDADLGLPCDVGTLYVDSNNNVQFCRGNAWGFLSGIWQQDNIGANATIYPSEQTLIPPRTTRVGIGTMSPTANLEVVHHNNWSTITSIAYSDTPTHAGVLATYRARGIEGGEVPVWNGDVLGMWQGRGWNDAEFKHATAIDMIAIGNWSAANAASKMRFVTTNAATQAMLPRMTIDDDGNIGIGTETPVRNLHIDGVGAGRILIEGDESSDSGLVFLTNGNGASNLGLGVTGWRLAAFGSAHPDAGAQNDLAFQYWDGAKWTAPYGIYIDHVSGNVGMGTRTSETGLKLSIAEDDRFAGIVMTTYADNPGDGGTFSMRRARGTRAGSQRVRDGDLLGVWHGGGYDGTGFRDSALISMTAVGMVPGGLWGAANRGGNIQFGTTDAATAVKAYRMTIADNGNVGIGVNAPQEKLHVQGSGAAIDLVDTGVVGDDGVSMYVHDDGSLVLSASARQFDQRDFIIQQNTGNVGIGTLAPTHKLEVSGWVGAAAFIIASDERLKEDIRPIKNALAKVLELKGVRFNFKETGEEEIGFIAQDVEKIFPELVTTSAVTGMKGVKYQNLIAVLIEALKEQQKIIDEQQQQIDLLESRLEALENKEG